MRVMLPITSLRNKAIASPWSLVSKVFICVIHSFCDSLVAKREAHPRYYVGLRSLASDQDWRDDGPMKLGVAVAGEAHHL
jgi:hypothetical protein